MTVNEALRSILLRRAVKNTQMERKTVQRVLQALRVLARLVDWQVRRHRDLFDKRGAATFGLPAADRLRTLGGEIMPALQGTLNEQFRAIGEMLAIDLESFARLELMDLPRELQTGVDTVVSKNHARPLREAEEVPASVATAGIIFNSTPSQQIAQLLTTPSGGGFYALSLARLSQTLLTQVQGILLNGLLRGEGVASVARAVQRAIGGTLWQAERIVRSEYVRIAGQATILTAERNAHLLSGVQWNSALDSRVCVQCAALDGTIYRDISKAPIPVSSTHAACRCVLTPVVKMADALDLPPSYRASFSGPVSDKLTYEEWFKSQSKEFQREVLGPTRYKLWASGKAKLGDFSTSRGVRDVRDVVALVAGRA